MSQNNYYSFNRKNFFFFTSPNSFHGFFVTKEKGHVFGFGGNIMYQLGLGNNEDQLVPVKVDFFQDIEIESIGTGYEFSIFQAKDGKFYAVGSNYGGKLCLGDEKNREKITELSLGIKEKVIYFAMGKDHVHFLTNDHKVFSCGSNKYGQLGIGKSDDKSKITDVTNSFPFQKIIDVKSGENFSIFFSKSKKLFGCGENYGQLGINNKKNQFIPVEIKFFRNINVIKFECGVKHTMVLTDKNEVYSFGYGGTFRLGNEANKSEIFPYKIKGLYNNFFVGGHHNIFCRNGQIFTFGYNGGGQCGTGKQENVKIPKKIGKIPFEDIFVANTQTYFVNKDYVSGFGCGYNGEMLNNKRDNVLSIRKLLDIEIKKTKMINIFENDETVLKSPDDHLSSIFFEENDLLKREVEELKFKVKDLTLLNKNLVDSNQLLKKSVVEKDLTIKNLIEEINELKSKDLKT